MSCGSTSSFLRRVVPLHRFGTVAVSSKFVPQSSPIAGGNQGANGNQVENNCIEYGTSEWSRAMCLLYRNLLVLHKHSFPVDDVRREFGDRFLATEFRRARSLDDKKSLTFYRGWLDYGVQLERGAAARGVSMSDEQEGKLNKDQREAMQKLRTEAFKQKGADYVPGAQPIFR